MLTTNFLKTRTSTRDFLDEKISDDKMKTLFGLVDEESSKYGKDNLSFLVNTDGENIYNSLTGIAGYMGVMIKAPIYIALNTLNTEDKTFVIGAYAMEDLITKLNEAGFGTCWVTVTDVKENIKQSVFNYTSGAVNHLLAVGLPKDTSVREHRYDDRKGVDEFVYIDDFNNEATVDELEQRGLADLFSYLRFAPSILNAQPWRFLIDGDEIKLYIENYKGIENLIDAGIVMYYFDELTKTIKTSKWEIKPELNGERFSYIAKIKL